MLIVAVKNTSGSTISAGQVVYQTDYLRPQQLPIVALASAATISTAEVLGICVWDIADNETGPIAVSGDVYPIDTSAFSAINDKVYLSDTPGAISATSGTVPAVIGTVKVVGAAGTINTTGTINIPTFSVTAITPSSGPTAGSTAVTITGAGFVSVTDVTIGGTSCTSIVTVDVNTITAVTPAGSAGAQDVVVTASAGVGTLTGGFTYVAVPTVTSITPTSGVTTGGTAVTIAGTNFFSAPGVPGASSVTIGGVACTGIVYVSAISITALAPAGTAGAQDVVVTTPYGIGTLAGGFTYVAAPTVTSITPNTGDYLGGTAVTIAGTDFLTSPGVPGALAVTIGGTTCTTIVYVSAISITAVSPAGSAGAQDVVVTTNYGTGTLVGGFTYTTFSNTYSMLFDGVSEYCESNSAASTTSGQPYSISLWSKYGGGAGWQSLVATGSPAGDISQAMMFRYFGSSLYIQGPWGYFWGGSGLSTTEWNHIVFTHAGTAGSHLLTWYVDGAVTTTMTGSASLLDEAWNMGRLWNYTASWTYGTNYIDEVSFFRGVALSLAEVQEIYNAGLPTDLTTHSKYTDLRSWWRMGDKMVGATLPDQGPASNDLTAYNSPTLSTDIPTNEPSITSITPANGVPGGGTAVTIAGSKFVDAGGAPGFVSVTIGGVTCTSIVAVSTSSITAVTPAGTLGPQDLVIVTVNGTATLSDGFLYTNYSFDGLIATSTAWPDLDPASPAYSISFWVKVNTYGSYDDLISLYCAGGSSYRLLVRVVNDSIRFYEGNADNAAHSNSTLNVLGSLSNNLSIWHHYVVASPGDGGTLRVYVDGQLQGLGTGKALSAAPSNTYLQIAHGSSPSYYAVTDTDEVSMFSIELNAAQALALFNDGAPSDISSHTGLTHWWRMGDTIGDTNTNLIDSVDAWTLDTVIGSTALIADVPFVRVTSMSPYYGLDTGSTAIAIVGSNFVNVTSVTIGGVACTSVVTVDANNITAVTPAGSAGAEDLIVTTTGGSFTLPDAFVYVAALPPVIGFANTYASFTDGIDDYWEGGTASGINSSGSYSVSIWVYLVQPSGYTSIMRTGRVAGWNSSYYKRCYLEYGFGSPGEVKLATYESDGNNTGTGTGSTISFVPRSLLLDQWSHFVMTSTGDGSANGCKLYRNGALLDTFTGVALSGSATPMVTQVAWNSQSSYSKQYSDEFCIWEGAVLSASNVTDLYNSGVPIDSSTIENGSITHFWRMGDLTDTSGASGVIYDRVGSADLAAGGAPRASTGVAAWTNANSIDFAGSKLTTRGVPWPDSDMDPASPAYSVSIWIQVDTIASYDAHFMLGYNSYSFRTYMIFTTPRLKVYEGDAGFETYSSTQPIGGLGCLTDNLYHHYVVTSPGDGGTVKLYIDGELRDWGAGQALSATPARNMMWVWLTSYTSSYMAPDTDDEIAIFGTELSSVQVTNLYNNGIPTDISSHAGIQHYWRMGDGVGDVVGAATVIRDQVGYMDLNNNSNVYSTGTNIASTDVPYVYINDIDPYYGLTAGGTAITITGSNFVIVGGSAVSGVTIGGAECTSVVTIDSNTLTAVTPAGSAGEADLIVTAIGGSQTAVGGFVYVASIPSWSNNYSMNFVSGRIYTAKGWPELSTTNLGYSISFWMKPNAVVTNYYFALASNKSVRCWLSSFSSGDFRFYEGNADDASPSATYGTAGGVLTDTLWHHYVFTSPGDGGTTTFYQDGVSVGTTTGVDLSATPSPHMWLVLGSTAIYTGTYAINLDEFAMFGTELSSVQVDALYNSGVPTDITSHAGIQHYWRMGDGIGDLGGATAILRDQVGYWDLNTTYGTPAIDADTPVWADFRSMYFDGVDDSISTSGAWPELSASGSGYSVSLWFKTDLSLLTPWDYVFAISDVAGKYRLHASFQHATGRLYVYEGNADTVSFVASQGNVQFVLLDTLWHHYAITSTGDGSSNGVKFYFDGVETLTFTGKALGSNLAATRLWMASYSGSTSHINGNIDEFSIFNAELSSAQVTALYNSGAPTDLSAHADIQHWWRMGDELDTASVIYDQEGSWDLDTPLNDPVLQTDTPLLIATQVEPYYGLSTGSTAITISGYNFDDVSPSTGVTIGGNACTSVVVGPTTITAATPASFSNASSLSFDGIDDGSQSGVLDAALSTSGWTASYWLYSTSFAGGTGYKITFSDSATSIKCGTAYSGAFQGASGNMSIWTGYPWDQSVSTTAYNGTWIHVHSTHTGTTSATGTNTSYINGVQLGSAAGGYGLGAIGLKYISIGYDARGVPPTGFFNCKIDEIAMCAGVVAPTEFYEGGVFANGPADLSGVTGIKHWWRCGDGSGDIGGASSIIYDQVGSVNLSQASGAPALDSSVPTSPPLPKDLVITSGSNSLTLTDGFVYVPSVPAWANTSSVEFDGSAFTTTENWAVSSSGSGYSVSFWLKTDPSLLTPWDYLFQLSNVSVKYRMYAAFSTTTGRFYVYEGNADTVSFVAVGGNAQFILLDTLWHHYAITSTGDGSSNGVKFYFDGVETFTFTGKALGSNLAATRLWMASNYRFSDDLICNIDEFAIFDSELNSTAVTALYNSGAPTDLSAHANIQHYYRMGDSIGDTATLIRDQIAGLDLDYPDGTPVIDANTPLLVATQVDPYYGLSTGGTAITISGYNFDDVPTSNGVTIGVYSTESMLFDGDGGNYALSTTAIPAVDIEGAFSVSFWAKILVAPVDDYIVYIGNPVLDTKARMRIALNSTPQFYFQWYPGENPSVTKNSGITVAVGNWYHVVVTSDSTALSTGTMRTYVNNVAGNTAALPITAPSVSPPYNVQIAKLANHTIYNFPGNVDEVSVWSKELSVSEINVMWGGGVPTDLTGSPGLISWWRMGESLSGTTIPDQQGSVDLTLYGAPLPVVSEAVPAFGDFTSVVVGSTTITAVTPSGPAGAQDLVITSGSNSLTLTDGFVYVPSIPAWANASSVEFDGSAFTTTENWAVSSSGSGYSVSFWLKTDLSLLTPWDYLFQLSNVSVKYRMYAAFSTTTGRFYVYEGNADTVSFVAVGGNKLSVLSDTLWHHYAITSTGDGSSNGVKVYFDGVEIFTFTGKALGSNLAATRLYVASNYRFSADLICNIDEFAIFDSELNSTAVTALYNSGTPTDLSAHANIQHYYRMGDSIGDTATLIRDQIAGLDLDYPDGTPVIDADVP